MKNLKPLHILLAGVSVVFFTTCFTLLAISQSHNIKLVEILLVALIVAAVAFAIFYVLIKKFITQKIKVLYRSIRKGKFVSDEDIQNISLNDDVIENVELETKKWSEARNAEISRLKEQEQFTREFIGNISHELKTPVFSIQGYILTLLDGGLEDESINRTFLERASKATDRMTTILEDLDLLTRMEVDQLRLDIRSFDIVELVQEVFEELEMKAKKKKIKLRFSKEFDPVYVNADRSKIGQVLTNLIANSIAYGHEGGEAVVRFYILDDIITIEISDNGPGIDEEHLPRLFERFYRVEKSRNRNEGGSGLGLAIVKKLIEAHGQTINVRSTPGVGSTFTFSLDKGRSGRRASI